MVYMIQWPVIRNKHIVPEVKANIGEDLLVKLTGNLKGQLISKVLVFISINPKVARIEPLIENGSIQYNGLLCSTCTKSG